MKKKIATALLSICFAHVCIAQVNYTEGNSNPYVKYEFKSAEEWAQIEKAKKTQQAVNTPPNLNYFSTTIQNPIKASNKGAYKHLIANSARLAGCWDKAAEVYKVDPWLLMAIAKTESSFNNVAINVNKNQSTDIGMMQINTIWLPTLRKFGIERENLFDPCTSIFVGAWILAQNIKQFGYNQDGIGAYNSPRNVVIRRNYAQKVYASYRQIVKDLYVQK